MGNQRVYIKILIGTDSHWLEKEAEVQTALKDPITRIANNINVKDLLDKSLKKPHAKNKR